MPINKAAAAVPAATRGTVADPKKLRPFAKNLNGRSTRRRWDFKAFMFRTDRIFAVSEHLRLSSYVLVLECFGPLAATLEKDCPVQFCGGMTFHVSRRRVAGTLVAVVVLLMRKVSDFAR